jgi:SAM-dependent methyltransferase
MSESRFVAAEGEDARVGGKVIELPARRQKATLSDAESVWVSALLQSGYLVRDEEFDRVYDGRWREPSATHWSSTRIIQRVVTLLSLREGEVVLDVGSGVGKFCLVGALITPAQFVGIERRPGLVEAAEHARRRLRAERARFLCDDALNADWSAFDCIYFFNPFEEHLMPPSVRIDDSTELSQSEYVDSVDSAQTKLEALKPGTRVAHFWGYGAEMPASFTLLEREQHGTGVLEVWRKDS